MQYLMTVNWWLANPSGKDKTPLAHHEEALAETANEIIANAMSEGITSGELSDNIFMLDSDIDQDGSEGIQYRGHWNFEAYKPVGTNDNPVIAIVEEDKEEGGFLMSISNVDRCEVVLVEKDICGEGNIQEIEGNEYHGWATQCDYDVTRTELFSNSF